MKQTIRTLQAPQVANEQIQEKIVCIRAHRERLFYTALEKKHGQFIFHNYGQGGAGWTFLFGCVNESLRQFDQLITENPTLKTKPITVIGAGCYGLLTACSLARRGHEVRIIAKDIDDVASYKAAGFFFPRPRKSSTPEEIMTFYARGIESYRTYISIAHGAHPFITQGAKVLPAYYGLDIDPGFLPYTEQGLIAHPTKVTLDFGNDRPFDAIEYKVIFIDAVPLMKELHAELKKLAIPITRCEIETFSDVPESILFNCTGLGAQKLTGDPKIVPVQGHLITLKNQSSLSSLQYMLNVKVTTLNQKGLPRDELIYYAPKDSGILGITFLRGESSLTSNYGEFDRLIERCKDFFW